MAQEAQTEEEPSIEEILDSIRQIISEDDDEEVDASEDSSEAMEEPAPEPAAEEPMDQSAVDDIEFDAPVAQEPEPDPEPEIQSEEDILELTDRVDEDGAMDVDLKDEDSEEEPEPEPEPEPVPEPVVSEESDIFTNKVENAASEAISQLVKKAAVERGGITLEEIARTELKPLLRDWLDKNLPTLIERLVSEELERVSKRLFEE